MTATRKGCMCIFPCTCQYDACTQRTDRDRNRGNDWISRQITTQKDSQRVISCSTVSTNAAYWNLGIYLKEKKKNKKTQDATKIVDDVLQRRRNDCILGECVRVCVYYLVLWCDIHTNLWAPVRRRIERWRAMKRQRGRINCYRMYSTVCFR